MVDRPDMALRAMREGQPSRALPEYLGKEIASERGAMGRVRVGIGPGA